MEGNLGELQLSNKHGECLDQGEPDVVEELRLLLLLLGHLGVGVEEDEEAEAKGDDEEGIPEEEGEEGGEDAEEHGGVYVAPGGQGLLKMLLWKKMNTSAMLGVKKMNTNYQCHVGCRPSMLRSSIQEMRRT